MKKIAFLSILVVALAACKKDTKKNTDTKITYLESMAYGHNVLTANKDSTIVDTLLPNVQYSFGAELGDDATLKVMMINLSDSAGANLPPPAWMYSDEQGWAVNSYFNQSQFFSAISHGQVLLKVKFEQGSGRARLDYYENSSKVTKSTYVVW